MTRRLFYVILATTLVIAGALTMNVKTAEKKGPGGGCTPHWVCGYCVHAACTICTSGGCCVGSAGGCVQCSEISCTGNTSCSNCVPA